MKFIVFPLKIVKFLLESMILLKDSVVFLLEPMVPLKAGEFLLEVVIQLERIELSCGPHDSIGIFQIFMKPVIQWKTIKFL